MGDAPNSRRHPVAFHSGLACAVTALLTAGLVHFQPWNATWQVWLATWLFVLNGVAFTWYGIDKYQAGRNGRRIPELVLHGLAVAGGSPGAYLGMRYFRHKTIKGRFRVVFWLIVAAQVAVIGWIVHYFVTHK
jgi:uncharacterized membrane protein YsdA (DUF1294 family)